jgi:chaperonin cofactor prefoldin
MTAQMQENPSQQVHVMLGLLAGQRDLYRQLKTLSEQQSRCVREGSTEELLSVLSQRQSVIEALSLSNAELAPYRDRWGDLATSAAPDQRQQVRDSLDEIERVLREVVEQDDRDRTELKSVQQQIGAQLNQVGKAGRAIRAYGSPSTNTKPPVFTDRQG